MAEQGKNVHPGRCSMLDACVKATQSPCGVGLMPCSAASGCLGELAMLLSRPGPGSGSPCKAKNSWGVTSSAFRLSSTCVCESTPLFFCETGCTRPPTEMVIKMETFIYIPSARSCT